MLVSTIILLDLLLVESFLWLLQFFLSGHRQFLFGFTGRDSLIAWPLLQLLTSLMHEKITIILFSLCGTFGGHNK